MEEQKKDPKERQATNLVYALADYKQLVIQYRTRHAELIRKLMFWKTSALWLAIIAAASLVFAFNVEREDRKQAAETARNLAGMKNELRQVSGQLEKWEKDIAAAREELDRKNEQVSQLEKNLSTMSKKQVEKLLKDSKETKAQ
ncbi:MAG: hypothetical protein ACM3OC_06820 [Deltaproteobacteria bacterium]